MASVAEVFDDLTKLHHEPKAALQVAKEIWQSLSPAMLSASDYEVFLIRDFQPWAQQLMSQALSHNPEAKDDRARLEVVILELCNRRADILQWLQRLSAPPRMHAIFSLMLEAQAFALLDGPLRLWIQSFLMRATVDVPPPLTAQAAQKVLQDRISGADYDSLAHCPTPDGASSPTVRQNGNADMTLLKRLQDLGLVAHLSEMVMEIASCRIRRHTTQAVRSNPMAAVLQGVIGWTYNTLFPVLSLCLPSANVKDLWAELLLQAIQAVATTRTAELHEVICRQEGTGAVIDLRISLRTLRSQVEFLEDLKKMFDCEVMKDSNSTHSILRDYITAIRTLRFIDPSGTLLDQSTLDLRNYVRARKDAIRTILDMLFDPEMKLRQELEGGEIAMATTEVAVTMNEIPDFSYMWQPAPIPVSGGNKAVQRLQSADILTILVNVYESKEIFMDEYRGILGARLLKSLNLNLSDELDVISKLKARFGEHALSSCDVMIYDISESKKLNESFHKELRRSNPVQALLISHFFWPAVKQDSVQFHSDIERLLKEYENVFKQHRPSRHLEWAPSYGKAVLDITLDDGNSYEVACSSQQATVFLYFQGTSTTWSVTDLVVKTGMKERRVQSCLKFWEGKGLLRRLSDRLFAVVPQRPGTPTRALLGHTPGVAGMHSPCSPASSPQVDSTRASIAVAEGTVTVNEVHEQLYRNFIQMFLLHQELTMDRLHERLSRAIIQNKPTLEQVEVVVGKLVQEGQVVESEGKLKVQQRASTI